MNYFWSFITNVCIIAVCACIAVGLWWVLSRGRQVTRDIIENVNETIVIFDRQDKPCYINLTSECGNIDESSFLESIERQINQSGCIPKNLNVSCLAKEEPVLFEGEITPYLQQDSVFSWKMCPIVHNKQYYGRIYVFSDITRYVQLQKQLDSQNRKLKKALEAQKEYIAVVKKLSIEEERERIILLINSIAQNYLEQLNGRIATMEACIAGGTQSDIAAYEQESDQMIQITRETIATVRNTVKELHVAI